MFACQEELTEGPRGRVSNALRSRLTVARGRTLLDRDGHQHLAGYSASTRAKLDAANGPLIGLNVAGQTFAAGGAHHRVAVTVQHDQGRLIAGQTAHALQSQRQDAVFLRGQLPGCDTVSGVRVSWKLVPAVRDNRRRQSEHRRCPLPSSRQSYSHRTGN